MKNQLSIRERMGRGLAAAILVLSPASSSATEYALNNNPHTSYDSSEGVLKLPTSFGGTIKLKFMKKTTEEKSNETQDSSQESYIFRVEETDKPSAYDIFEMPEFLRPIYAENKEDSGYLVLRNKSSSFEN